MLYMYKNTDLNRFIDINYSQDLCQGVIPLTYTNRYFTIVQFKNYDILAPLVSSGEDWRELPVAQFCTVVLQTWFSPSGMISPLD